MFETVVVGADGSATAAEAVRVAIELVKLTAGSCTSSPPTSRSSCTSPAGEEFSESFVLGRPGPDVLTDLASRARSGGIAVETHLQGRRPGRRHLRRRGPGQGRRDRGRATRA